MKLKSIKTWQWAAGLGLAAGGAWWYKDQKAKSAATIVTINASPTPYLNASNVPVTKVYMQDSVGRVRNWIVPVAQLPFVVSTKGVNADAAWAALSNQGAVSA